MQKSLQEPYVLHFSPFPMQTRSFQSIFGTPVEIPFDEPCKSSPAWNGMGILPAQRTVDGLWPRAALTPGLECFCKALPLQSWAAGVSHSMLEAWIHFTSN